jgi:hypothetical protein
MQMESACRDLRCMPTRSAKALLVREARGASQARSQRPVRPTSSEVRAATPFVCRIVASHDQVSPRLDRLPVYARSCVEATAQHEEPSHSQVSLPRESGGKSTWVSDRLVVGAANVSLLSWGTPRVALLHSCSRTWKGRHDSSTQSERVTPPYLQNTRG